jgi:PmbA protein
MGTITLRNTAEGALALMRSRGFDAAQATAAATRMDELSILDDEPSLLRSTDSLRMGLVGIVDGRRAATELTDLRPDAVRETIDGLLAVAKAAPRDEANQVSSGQSARIEQGPQASDLELLSAKARELLDHYRSAAPKVRIRESMVAHTLRRSHTLTTGGTDLEASVGHHTLSSFGVARGDGKASSFCYAGGDCHAFERPAAEYFGIAEMLDDLQRSIHTQPVGGKFVGDVVLMPTAVEAFLGWFLGQICDEPLIAGSSLFRTRVGEATASPLLTLRSRFDAPGVVALSMDAFATPPVEILGKGVLKALTPSLYGSRKTGLPHVPTAAAGWELAAGDTSRDDLISKTTRGALVGRLSMGRPAANGDFSGVIKNSFAIVDGKVGHALSETMISGNVAHMLRDVIAVSRERIDTGAFLLPWLRIGGLHFS